MKYPTSIGRFTFYSWGIDFALQSKSDWEQDRIKGWITFTYRNQHLYFSPDATPCHPNAKTFLGAEYK